MAQKPKAVPANSASPGSEEERTDSELRRPAPTSSWSIGSVLDGFLRDPSITEIMVNDTRGVMLEREGKLVFSGFSFAHPAELGRVVEHVLQLIDRKLTLESPCADGTLPDGTRVHVVGPPVALGGPSLTFRKFPARGYTLEQLLQAEMIDLRMAQFLNACVVGKMNLILSGGTGSGKTTLMNALLQLVPKGDRLVTIEDTPELSLQHPNSVRLRSTEHTSARALVASALRMRPDRIIVGECRGGEALDMLQAMNTGHAGSMTTLHANSPRDVISRLETLCLLSEVELPLTAVRKQIAASIDLVIQLKRSPLGRRRVIAITEVTGMESDTVTLQDLFLVDMDPKGTAPERFRCTGFVPTFLSRLREQGVDLPPDFFR